MQRAKPPSHPGLITATAAAAAAISNTKPPSCFYPLPSLSTSPPSPAKTDAPPRTTTFSLNSAIRSHLSTGHPERALAHFLESQRRGLVKPDNFTIPSLLKLSSDLKQPPLHGEHIHTFAVKSGHLDDLFVRTGLVELYLKYGSFETPRRLFDETSQRDLVLCTAMVSGFSRNGLAREALEVFSMMLGDGIKPNNMTVASVLSACSQLMMLGLGRALHGFSLRSGILDKVDVILQTSLVDMYTKCRSLDNARNVFEKMTERNSVSWNAIISGYSAIGLFQKVFELFKDMVHEGFRQPKSSTIVAVLNICGTTTDLRKGKQIHGYIFKSTCKSSEFDGLVENNAVIDMYVKNGNLESAVSLFNSMPRRSLVTWTAMIAGYGTHGLSGKALQVFNEMKESGVSPDGVTFISLLSACSHGGLVEEGEDLYISMQQDYNIAPEMKHFVCMVDLYGRAGMLEEAYNFIERMPVEPSKYIWSTLLSSCRNHKHLRLGEYAAKKASELDPCDVGICLHLSRIYADAGRWEEVAKVRLVMKEMGLRPETACSWVEMKGNVYKFTVGDHFKGLSKRIYRLLETLTQIMVKASFMPDITTACRHVSQEGKLSDLCGHTEKLALAFVLIQCGGEGPIRIGKNLRVCRDCHESFKFVSMIYNVEIILKDPNRYHRFGLGCCSCHDYW